MSNEIEIGRAKSYASHFRRSLEKVLFESVHGAITQKIGMIFAVIGIPCRLANTVFVRSLETDADARWLPDYSFEYGRTVFVHHDMIDSKSVTLSRALSVRNTGNHLIYVADRLEDLPAIIRDNAAAIIQPEINVFELAVSAFRNFFAELNEKDRKAFKLVDADRTSVTDVDQIFYKCEGVVKGKGFRRIDKPLAFISEIFFMFRDFAYEAYLASHAVVLCADWQKPPIRTSDVARDELESIPLLKDFPGITELRPRIQKLLDRHASPHPPRSGILFYGPPGTGKTMLARTIAKSSGRNLIVTSVGAWQSGGHLGDVLQRMTDDFRRAREMTPSMIFIDELDSLPDRRIQGSSNQFYETAVTNRFLELVDGFTARGNVLVIGATNNKDGIDPAVLRAGRFGDHLYVPYPNLTDATEIIQWYLDRAECRHGIGGEISASQLAVKMASLAPSAIRSIVDEAVDACNDMREPLDVHHFETAFSSASENLGLRRGAADPEWVAVHEAGHAIALHLLMRGSISKVRIDQAVLSNGMVIPSPAWRFETTPRMDICRGIVCMAGRAAEYLVLGAGRLGYGAGTDISMATDHGTALARAGLSPDGFSVFVDPSDRAVVSKTASQWVGAFNSASISLLKDHVGAIRDLVPLLIAAKEMDGDECHQHLASFGVPSDFDISSLIAL